MTDNYRSEAAKKAAKTRKINAAKAKAEQALADLALLSPGAARNVVKGHVYTGLSKARSFALDKLEVPPGAPQDAVDSARSLAGMSLYRWNILLSELTRFRDDVSAEINRESEKLRVRAAAGGLPLRNPDGTTTVIYPR